MDIPYTNMNVEAGILAKLIKYTYIYWPLNMCITDILSKQSDLESVIKLQNEIMAVPEYWHTILKYLEHENYKPKSVLGSPIYS